MTSTRGSATPGRAPVWPLYRAMVGVGIGCGLLIVMVYQLTGPVIARNRAAALEEAILEVLPGSVASQTFRVVEGALQALPAGESAAPGDRVLHAAYGEQGELVGVAIEAAGMGYADTIRVLYGYSPETDAIVGFRVLESRETPGLGDRIAFDPDFLANFERLPITLDDAGEKPLHSIVAVAQGTRSAPGEIDGLTGATISSLAVAKLLDTSVTSWVPLVERQAASLQAAPPVPEDPP